MPGRKKQRVKQADIVRRFAARLREMRHSRGMTQLQLADKAEVTTSYVTRLERATSAPGIDLVDRLARALGCTVGDLLPTADPPDQTVVLREQVRQLCDMLTGDSDATTLSLAAQLLARLASSER